MLIFIFIIIIIKMSDPIPKVEELIEELDRSETITVKELIEKLNELNNEFRIMEYQICNTMI